jgi:dTDP-4-amino-4,6-dideoxygalactose transaminase
VILDNLISRRREAALSSIQRHYSERALQHVILVASARLGLYAAFKAALRPGDRVIISPLTCHSVIDALLAAGMQPVLANIDPANGNLDVMRLPHSLTATARAIVTTNLYGNADDTLELRRLADIYGLLLIEDCAHVLQTTIEGKELGSIGDVSVFSFKKYFHQSGGVVTARDPMLAQMIERELSGITNAPALQEERLRYLQAVVQGIVTPAGMSVLSRSIKQLTSYSAAGIPSHPQPLQKSSKSSVPFCDDKHRRLPVTASLMSVARTLEHFNSFVLNRAMLTQSLIESCPLPLKGRRQQDKTSFLSVPFFSGSRDEVVRVLKGQGIPTYFMYNPPANDIFKGSVGYAHDFDAGVVREWSRNILPIPPEHGCLYVDAIKRSLTCRDGRSTRSATSS